MKDVNILKNNGVDVDASLELFGDMETYDETLVDYLNGVDEKTTGLTKFCKAGDMPNYAILVHSLKSDARYLGFTKLGEMAYDQEMKSKANDQAYITANINALLEETAKVNKLVREYLGDTSTVVVEASVDVSNPTILLVDDSDVIRNFVKKIFNNTYNVIVAEDGKQAIDTLTASDTHNLVGLFLDLNMPNIDGFEVLEFLKNNNLFTKVPTSIITGDDSKEAIERAFTYPIIDMLNKPFSEDNVKFIVEKTINLNK